MFDLLKLRKRCLQPTDDFRKEGEVVECRSGFYAYKDNGSDILAVAHLDMVQEEPHFYVVRIGGHEIVFNNALDDRLGAHIILDVLPALGINCDVLLTTGEEHCDSTAQYFKTAKKYKWMFSFDRSGTDVVLYQYGGAAIENILEGLNNVVGMGSYSDICELSNLGCVGINWGCGYEENHNAKSHVVLQDAEYMIGQFKAFYDMYKDTALVWEDDGMGDDYGYGYARMGKYVSSPSDIEWDEDYRGRTAGLTKHEKDIYYATYRDLRVRGWQDKEAQDAALDEVAYEIHRFGLENREEESNPEWDKFVRQAHAVGGQFDDDDEETIEGEYKWMGPTGECLICGRDDCMGMMECDNCHAQFHDNTDVAETGKCGPCMRRLANERMM